MVRVRVGMRLRSAKAAIFRMFRSTSAPTSVSAESLLSSWRRRRAAQTVTMMSLISGTRDISLSSASRGTHSSRLSRTGAPRS